VYVFEDERSAGRMKGRLTLIVAMMIVLGASFASSQFKSQVPKESNVSEGLIRSSAPSFFLGWFNPERFHMRHSFNLSYQTFGGSAFSLGTYTNSMVYEFADNLNARADISLSYSPYNSLSTFGKNELSNVYLSRAQVNYSPWENVLLQLQYRELPYSSYYLSPWHSPWYRENGF
jgi:hypothetical protein